MKIEDNQLQEAIHAWKLIPPGLPGRQHAMMYAHVCKIFLGHHAIAAA
jgi:hypothetical protein